MERKGSAWIIVFFLVIVFVLMNTLSIEEASTTLKVEARTEDGGLADADIGREHFLPDTIPEGELYQHFTAKMYDGNITLIIDVNSEWLAQNLIAAENVTIYRQAGNSWQPVTIKDRKSFATTTSYYIEKAQDGSYFIIGTTGTAEPVKSGGADIKMQIGILIIVIIVILFVQYHQRSKRDQPHKEPPDLKKLHQYVKESLLAGHDEKEIRERLLSAGWTNEQITQGIRAARFF